LTGQRRSLERYETSGALKVRDEPLIVVLGVHLASDTMRASVFAEFEVDHSSRLLSSAQVTQRPSFRIRDDGHALKA
jgi:hypothetical protein